MNRIAAVIGAGLFTAVSALPGSVSPITEPAADPLTTTAGNARTACAHSAAAYRLEMQARALEAAAKTHEEEAARAARRFSPLAHKWPAMVQAPADGERTKAREARTAAAQALKLSSHHRQLARAALAAGTGTDSNTGSVRTAALSENGVAVRDEQHSETCSCASGCDPVAAASRASAGGQGATISGQ